MTRRPRPVARTRSGAQGFTLIELLVVIAIIAILAAILFPVFSQARDKARAAACLSNQKQVGLAVMQYTQDYDEMLPLNQDFGASGPYNWQRVYWTLVDPYVKGDQVLFCPSDPDPGVFGAAGRQSYIANQQLGWTGPGNSGRGLLTSIQAPANCILFLEWTSTDTPRTAWADDLNWAINNRDRFPTAKNQWAAVNRHNEGANWTFCDGHAKWAKPITQVSSRNSTANDGKVAWFPPNRQN